MNDPTVMVLLVIAVLVGLVSLVIQFAQWFMHDGLSKRVARLEANEANQMTRDQVIRIHERLSSLDSKMETLGTSLHSIQDHLLEHD